MEITKILEKIPYLSYILFFSGIIIYIFTFNLINGNLFNLYSDYNFPIEKYSKFWKEMTSNQRLFLTETYYKFYLNMKDNIDNMISNKKNNNLQVTVKYLNSNFQNNSTKYFNVPFVLVSLIPNNLQNNEKKLLIASHFDGHNLTTGGTAYDDAIHTVSMLGTIEALLNGDYNLNFQVDFLFDGAEEFGLIGAYQYAEYLKNLNIKENYEYLNLEAMGAGLPYVFIIKGIEGSYTIQKTLSYVRGTILLPSNYLLGLVGSTTDHVVFDKQGWKGGVSVFLGKGSVYHTKYDAIISDEHLKICGNQLLSFVLNYDISRYDGDSVGYGIAPICVVLPLLVMEIIIPLIFLGSLFLLYYKEKENIKEFLKDLLKGFICIIIVLVILLLESLLISLINCDSFAASQVYIGLINISGFFIFSIFSKILKVEKWSRIKLVMNILLMLIFITTDLSLPLTSVVILSIIFYYFDNKIIKIISSILEYLIISLIFSVITQIFTQLSVRIPGVLSGIFCFLIFFLMTSHLSLSPLGLYENKNTPKNEETVNDTLNEEIIESVKEFEKIKNQVEMNYTHINLILMIVYIAFPLFILLLLFIIPYPYSKDYINTGTFFNLFTEPNKSKLIFIPEKGFNYAKNNVLDSKFKNIKEEDAQNYLSLGFPSKSFVYDSNDNKIIDFNGKCEVSMPKLNFSEILTKIKIDDNTYDYNFNFNIDKKICIDALFIKVNCDKCVKKKNGFENNNDISSKYLGYDYSIRVGKEIINDTLLPDFKANFTLTLNTDKFNFSIYLNTLKNTKEYLEFMESFGEASCTMATTAKADTLFKYELVSN